MEAEVAQMATTKHGVEIDPNPNFEDGPLYGVTMQIGSIPGGHTVWFDRGDMRELIDLMRRVSADGTAQMLQEVLDEAAPQAG